MADQIPVGQSVSRDQRRILEFIAVGDGEGCVLAYDIAGALNLSPKGMGGRMMALWMKGLVEKVIVKAAPSPRSDALVAWVLTDQGRASLRGPSE